MSTPFLMYFSHSLNVFQWVNISYYDSENRYIRLKSRVWDLVLYHTGVSVTSLLFPGDPVMFPKLNLTFTLPIDKSSRTIELDLIQHSFGKVDYIPLLPTPISDFFSLVPLLFRVSWRPFWILTVCDSERISCR